MTAPTHIAFSALVYLYICTLFRIPLHMSDVLLCAVTSLLPDLDISSSGIGRRVPFISSRIEKRFGHRTLTHSFVGVLLVGLLALPLSVWNLSGYLMCVLGYWTHIFIDIFNKDGVAILYPYRKWGVFPVNPDYRIAVGSATENLLLVGLIVLSCLLYPIASVGLNRSLHVLFANISGAVDDYNQYSSHYEVFAQFEGTYRKTSTKVKGRFKVVDALSENALLVIIDNKARIVGTTTNAHIVPSHIRVHKGAKIVTYTQLVMMDGHTLGELFRLKDTDHRLFGSLHTLTNHFNLSKGVLYADPITASGSTLILDHATYADIAECGLENIPALASNLLVKTSLPPDALYRPFSFSKGALTVFPVEISIASAKDILVKPGQTLNAGQLIASHSARLREITLIESKLETEKKVRNEASYQYGIDVQRIENRLTSVKTEIDQLSNTLRAYQSAVGFEKECEELKTKITTLKAQQKEYVSEQKGLASSDSQDRLRYQQRITELLAHKASLEATAFTRCSFECEVVNIEFQPHKAILYLRRIKQAVQEKG